MNNEVLNDTPTELANVNGHGAAPPPPSGHDHAGKLIVMVSATLGDISTAYIATKSVVITLGAAVAAIALVLAYWRLHR